MLHLDIQSNLLLHVFVTASLSLAALTNTRAIKTRQIRDALEELECSKYGLIMILPDGFSVPMC